MANKNEDETTFSVICFATSISIYLKFAIHLGGVLLQWWNHGKLLHKIIFRVNSFIERSSILHEEESTSYLASQYDTM